MTDYKRPAPESLRIADDIITSYLVHIGNVDSVLFRRFDAHSVANLQSRLREPVLNLKNAEWNDLSQFLRSVSLSLRPFPDLKEKHSPDTLYKAIDEIADYALTLPDEPPARVAPPQGRKHGL